MPFPASASPLLRWACAPRPQRPGDPGDSEGGSVAATFTRNAFCAAPVVVAREHLAAAAPRFLVINAGNANAGTGEPGMAAARRVCELVAAAGGL